MSEYRKKPVVIEAFRWTGGPDQTENPQWCVDAILAGTVRFENSGTPDVAMLIDTLEGTHRANQGDFIIKGVKGELYPCKPDIFALTYEPASTPTDETATATIEGLRAALLEARSQLEAYELERSGEAYNSLQINAALNPQEAKSDTHGLPKNLLLHNQSFDDAPWGKSSTTLAKSDTQTNEAPND